MTTDALAARVDALMDQATSDLIELVAIPSVSASSFDQTQLDRSAAWVADKARGLGLDAEVITLTTDSGLVGRPAVLASRPAADGKPTVLLYAHHDVQPPGSDAGWLSEPFVAVERDGRLFGRGTADDKAGILVHLTAIAAADPGVGITLYVEGEEEVGSPTFVDFLTTYRDRLAADVIVVADSNNWKVGTPSLTTSLRGVCTVTMTLSVLDHALHSGMYGGPILDAVTLTSRLVATLHDDAGDVAVAGLTGYDTTEADYPEVDLRADSGVLDGVQFAGSGSLASRLWTKPAIAVVGMDVTPTDIASNTIIPSTKTVLSLRVAPGQDPAEAAQALVDHLKANVPFGAQLDVTIDEMGPAFSAGEDTDVTHMAREALETAWGAKSVDIGVGGSIPFIADLKKIFPEADILVTGVEDPDTRAHSQNESLHLGDWRNAVLAEAIMLTRLGE